MTGEKWEKTEEEEEQEEEEEEEGGVRATYEITRGKRHEITKEDRFIPWHVSFPRIASCAAAASSRETLSYASFPFPPPPSSPLFDDGQIVPVFVLMVGKALTL